MSRLSENLISEGLKGKEGRFGGFRFIIFSDTKDY
jgi:hypothetical protein